MNGKPGQHTNGLPVGSSLEPQESHGLVDAVCVLDSLRLGVSEIRVQAPVDVGVINTGCAKVEIALENMVSLSKVCWATDDGSHLLKRLMSPLDGLDSTVHNCLVALLVKAKAGNLGQEVVEPASWATVGMGARNSDVTVVVHGIPRPKSGQALEDTVPNSGVTGHGIEDQVDEAVLGIGHLANDEGTTVDALTNARANLSHVGIASKVDFDHRASDIALTRSDEVLVAGSSGSSLGEERIVRDIGLLEPARESSWGLRGGGAELSQGKDGENEERHSRYHCCHGPSRGREPPAALLERHLGLDPMALSCLRLLRVGEVTLDPRGLAASVGEFSGFIGGTCSSKALEVVDLRTGIPRKSQILGVALVVSPAESLGGCVATRPSLNWERISKPVSVVVIGQAFLL